MCAVWRGVVNELEVGMVVCIVYKIVTSTTSLNDGKFKFYILALKSNFKNFEF